GCRRAAVRPCVDDLSLCHPERERGAWRSGWQDDRATRPPGPSLTLGVTLARRPVDAPAVPPPQPSDPLLDRNLRHLAPAANPRRLAAAQLLLLRGVEKMDERQVAPPPHPPVQPGAP